MVLGEAYKTKNMALYWHLHLERIELSQFSPFP